MVECEAGKVYGFLQKAIEKFRKEYDFERAVVLLHALIIDAETGEKEEYFFDSRSEHV